MKDQFRQSMAWLHTWTGLALGWVLFFMFITGTAGYFDTEIDRWMQPELPVARQVDVVQAARTARTRLEHVAPNASSWFISLPLDRNAPYLRISWKGTGAGKTSGNEQLDLVNGMPLSARETGGGNLLYRMHWKLHYLPEVMSDWAVGIATMFMLVALVTGVIVHKKIFADFFTFRPGKGQRSWLDAHNVTSVISLPFQLMITYSGLIFMMYTYMPLVVAAYYGPGADRLQAFTDEVSLSQKQVTATGVRAPLVSLDTVTRVAQARYGENQIRYLEVLHPHDQNARVTAYGNLAAGPLRNAGQMVFDGVSGELLAEQPGGTSGAKVARDVMLGLHEGLFAGPVLRWLYFFSGLLGAAMIATGLVLWTVKRRQRLEKAGGTPHPGLCLVERLNIGTVVGLPVGIAAYFWANRLIPADVAGRAAWEVNAMFLAWGAMLLHAALRPTARAWVEQFCVASTAFLLLPVLNALTTDRHLGASLPAGDWVFAGFDLALLGLGLAFAGCAWWVARLSPAGPAGTTAPQRREPAKLVESTLKSAGEPP